MPTISVNITLWRTSRWVTDINRRVDKQNTNLQLRELKRGSGERQGIGMNTQRNDNV